MVKTAITLSLGHLCCSSHQLKSTANHSGDEPETLCCIVCSCLPVCPASTSLIQEDHLHVLCWLNSDTIIISSRSSNSNNSSSGRHLTAKKQNATICKHFSPDYLACCSGCTVTWRNSKSTDSSNLQPLSFLSVTLISHSNQLCLTCCRSARVHRLLLVLLMLIVLQKVVVHRNIFTGCEFVCVCVCVTALPMKR